MSTTLCHRSMPCVSPIMFLFDRCGMVWHAATVSSHVLSVLYGVAWNAGTVWRYVWSVWHGMLAQYRVMFCRYGMVWHGMLAQCGDMFGRCGMARWHCVETCLVGVVWCGMARWHCIETDHFQHTVYSGRYEECNSRDCLSVGWRISAWPYLADLYLFRIGRWSKYYDAVYSHFGNVF